MFSLHLHIKLNGFSLPIQQFSLKRARCVINRNRFAQVIKLQHYALGSFTPPVGPITGKIMEDGVGNMRMVESMILKAFISFGIHIVCTVYIQCFYYGNSK